MTFQESISKAIESQRNRLGITATELSKRLGISRQYYYMLKSNDALWKIEQLGKSRIRTGTQISMGAYRLS